MTKHIHEPPVEREVVDANRNGIEDDIEPPPVDIEASRHELELRLSRYTSTGPRLTGGDVDAAWETADTVGEEAVGGSVVTPDQNVVEELGEAVGITYQDDEVLRPGEKEHDRDIHRWELDPASSEDWIDRQR